MAVKRLGAMTRKIVPITLNEYEKGLLRILSTARRLPMTRIVRELILKESAVAMLNEPRTDAMGARSTVKSTQDGGNSTPGKKLLKLG